MENITPSMWWAGIAAVLTAFLLISNVAEKIVKIVKAAKAPNEAQNTQIKDHENRLRRVERKLENDKERLDDLEAGSHATLQALLALLDHGIDGNNIKQMQDAKEAVQSHLINR